MEFSFPIGMQNTLKIKVEQNMTASALDSGTLDVLGTPFLVALMEAAAERSVALPEGYTTVGTQVNIRHTASTPVGMEVTITSTLTAQEGRKLVFRVEASDEKGSIGHGEHERFIINAARFMEKTYAKLK
jgi:fluoroacetyl-CoA thioesterase